MGIYREEPRAYNIPDSIFFNKWCHVISNTIS
nr:MAG TPA: hypothetical protein [Caudoviricetes sp.]